MRNGLLWLWFSRRKKNFFILKIKNELQNTLISIKFLFLCNFLNSVVELNGCGEWMHIMRPILGYVLRGWMITESVETVACLYALCLINPVLLCYKASHEAWQQKSDSKVVFDFWKLILCIFRILYTTFRNIIELIIK